MYSSEPHISKIESAELTNNSVHVNDNVTIDLKFNYLTLIFDITDNSEKRIHIGHILNNDLREMFMTMIKEYNPIKVKSTDVKMKIILTSLSKRTNIFYWLTTCLPNACQKQNKYL